MLVAEDLGDQRGVADGRRVLERVVEPAVLATPLARRRVQPRRGSRLDGRELELQQLAEEVVVAIPLAVGVERDEEAVLALEPAEPGG